MRLVCAFRMVALGCAAFAVGTGCGTSGSSPAGPADTGGSESGESAPTGAASQDGGGSDSTGGASTAGDLAGATSSSTSVATTLDGTDSGTTEAGGECITELTAGTHVFDCGHLTFDVSVPAPCLEESCGLIVDVHGRTMSAQMQEANTRLRALGMERGYVVVQPNANPSPPLSSWDGQADDLVVVDFVDRVVAAYAIDPDRVHLTGFSQGGSMTWRLLASHGELWASAAPGAACGIGLPSQVVPIVYMHGTADALIPYACAEPHVDALIRHYGLSEGAQVVESGDEHSWLRYGESDPGIVEFLAHDYDSGNAVLGGHCYPGSEDPGGAPGQLFTFACGSAEAFTWGEVVIDFFDAHPRVRG